MPDEKKKDDDKAACPYGDSLVVGPEIGGGAHLCVRHTDNHELTVGAIRPVQDGEPIDDNTFALEPQGGPLYAVKSVLDRPKGPAKVASNAYRDGWDTIFGKKQPIGEA